MFCESPTIVCQRKIGNKKGKERKGRKRLGSRHIKGKIRAKVDHVTDCIYHERDTHSFCDGLTGSEACRVGSRGSRLPAL